MKQSAIIRLGGLRAVAMFVMNIAGALIAILLLPVVFLYPSASGHRPDVVVRDEAGIYHEQTLRRGLEEQHYDRELRIVVLSVPGAGIGNIDEETVKYAADGAQGSSWFQGSDVGSPVNGTILFVVRPSLIGCVATRRRTCGCLPTSGRRSRTRREATTLRTIGTAEPWRWGGSWRHTSVQAVGTAR